ncbi:MAG TPA: NAD(P)-dependent glycerol-3-phosphate dehydrogenase [Euryarchaeota archaeon]|nr:NAD(P)-dependent glycerol-3-phosphate dehydrogenase [Euryarchaeota archaeon]
MSSTCTSPYKESGKPQRICVLGGGSWGTTIACLLSSKGYDTYLWVRNNKKADAISKNRENKTYLPGIMLPPGLNITSDMKFACRDSDMFVMAVPTIAFRGIIKGAAGFIHNKNIVVSATKGLESGTNYVTTDIISETVPHAVPAVLSGPNHAEEIAAGMPGASVVSAECDETRELLMRVFATPNFRIYGNSDMRGVQLCAAVKNVIALAAGVGDGLGFGDNAKAGLITRGVKEISTFGSMMGAKKETFFGLAGIGDLIATCVSKHSRNRTFGERMGKGMTFDEAVTSMGGMVVEGVNTAKVIEDISKKHGRYFTIPHEVYNLIYEHKKPADIVEEIMNREPKLETH